MDALGNPTGFHLTPGQAHDLEGADVLLHDTPAEIVIADKGYDARERVVEPLERAGKQVVIPSRENAKKPREYDRDLYKERHLGVPQKHRKDQYDLSMCVSYTRDEGRPFGVGFQERASNHFMLLRSRAVVKSDGVKA